MRSSVKSRFTRSFDSEGVFVNNYASLVSAIMTEAAVIIVADYMDLNRCEAIRQQHQDGLEEETFL
jgi:hypothetical protein